MPEQTEAQGISPEAELQAKAMTTTPTPVVEGLPPSTVPAHHHKKILFSVLGVVLLLAAGGALAYVYYPLPPEKVLVKTMEKSATLATLTYKAQVTGSVTSESPLSLIPKALNLVQTNSPAEGTVAGSTTYQIQIDLSGSVDGTDANHPKTEFSINGKVADYALALDMKLLDKLFFFRLTQAPDIGIVDLTKILNIWIKVDLDELNQTTGADVKPTELTEQQKKQLRDLFAQTQLLTVTKTLASEKIGDVATYHYAYSLNKANLINYVVRVGEIVNNEISSPSEKKEIEDMFANVTFQDGELWIGKKDYFLRKITGGLAETANASSSESGEIKWQLEISNLNLPVNIQAPADAKTIEEVMQLFMPSQEVVPTPPTK